MTLAMIAKLATTASTAAGTPGRRRISRSGAAVAGSARSAGYEAAISFGSGRTRNMIPSPTTMNGIPIGQGPTRPEASIVRCAKSGPNTTGPHTAPDTAPKSTSDMPRARHVARALRGGIGRGVGAGVFGPLFAHRTIDASGLVGPWLMGIPFMVVGLGIMFLVRPDPKEIAASYPAERAEPATAAPLREILRRPGVPAAVLAVVASFAIMASVMNLAGYVAVGRGHHQGDVFTMISVHILGT